MNNVRDTQGRFKGKQKIKVKCETCGKELLRHPCRFNVKHQFCNMKCHGEYTKLHGYFKKGHKLRLGCAPGNKGITNAVKRFCSNCNKEIMIKNWEKDKKRCFCGLKCLAEFKIKNHNKYYPKQREIKCKQCDKIFTTYNKSNQIFCGVHCKNMFFRKEKKYLEKLRESKLSYIEKTINKGLPIMPTIGNYETSILDNLEDFWGCKIIRQKRIAGYFIDGYCPMFNLAIEIDESHHNKQLEKDKEREQVIKERIGCFFFRIGVNA